MPADRSRARPPTRSTGPAHPVGPADPGVGVVGPREPCPCGSGRRYKACHGRPDRPDRAAAPTRPFAGLPGECDWVALREIVPAATAPLTLRAQLPPPPADQGPDPGVDQASASPPVIASTVLPLGHAAMVRLDGQVFLEVQAPARTTDPSVDLGTALATALASPPGTLVGDPGAHVAPVRLQDLLDPGAPFEVTVRDSFQYWLDGADPDGGPGAGTDPRINESMERANAGIVPTQRLTAVSAAYWAGLADRSTIRWVLPEDEEPLLDALARLHAGGGLLLGAGSRFIGTFRAHGLLAPVWDLPTGATADQAEGPAEQFRRRLDEALADTTALTTAQRHARAGLQTRQLTLR